MKTSFNPINNKINSERKNETTRRAEENFQHLITEILKREEALFYQEETNRMSLKRTFRKQQKQQQSHGKLKIW